MFLEYCGMSFRRAQALQGQSLVMNLLLPSCLFYLQSILSQLRSEDESLQLDALSQLNELLAVSMADSLGLYPVEQLIPVLVIIPLTFSTYTRVAVDKQASSSTPSARSC